MIHYEQPEPKECPHCGGTGYEDKFMIMNIDTREEIETTEEEWNSLPEDEDQAFDEGFKFIRLDREECHLCHGYGIESIY